MNLNNDIIDKATELAGAVLSKTENFDVAPWMILAMKVPGVKINRKQYLQKELSVRCPKETVEAAIAYNPAYAEIDNSLINKISNQAIKYETAKVSTISFAAGIPGGVAMVGTIAVDILQYFGFLLRVMQKLAYLYGFDEFELNEDEIDDETLNIMLVMLGVMFGVQGANATIKTIAGNVAARIARTLPRKALTKGAIYPIVKKIATQLGFRMTTQIFAEGVSKIVPVIGGFASGALTYATFKPCCYKLKKQFVELPTNDPSYFEKERVRD